ncbi:MAG: MarR family transcriptional regulator, partial [Cocleimonas sp.]
LDSSAVSTLVARMEKKSLIKRVHGVEDRRTVFVHLTEEGDRLKRKINNKSDILTQTLNSNITEEESKVLQDIVMKIKLNREPMERSQIREFSV